MVPLDTLSKEAERAADTLLKGWPAFHYPFGDSVKKYMQKEGMTHITIVSYGSLMNCESASRTIGYDSLKSRKPFVAFGLRRVFNRDVDLKGSKRYKMPEDPLERGMLNTICTGDMNDVINGVYVNVPISEITSLCRREAGYDLVPAVALDWEDALEGKTDFFVGYTFVAPECGKDKKRYTHPEILPIKQYYDVVEKGACQYGDEFHQMWLDTTFLADGKTSVKDWSRNPGGAD